jgi:hypothetical protein
MARRYSSAAVAMGHNALTRAVRHAEARDLVGRHVALLVETPKGQAGRPGTSLSLEQASALLAAAAGTRMHACIALCLATGIRAEEAGAPRWEHVDFGDPVASPPGPASAAVRRSVRSHGDTKTAKSRRTLEQQRNKPVALVSDHSCGLATGRGVAPELITDVGVTLLPVSYLAAYEMQPAVRQHPPYLRPEKEALASWLFEIELVAELFTRSTGRTLTPSDCRLR